MENPARPATDPSERFAAAWTALERELDWGLLGRLHCEGGGDDFFAKEDSDGIFETGLRFAEDLADALPPGGRSLWVGASVAECVPILAEALCMEREVLWRDLPGPIIEELRRGLEAASKACGCELPRPATDSLESVVDGSCDHVWAVSVLTDPEHFPALHDTLYERTGALATGRGDLQEDHARAVSIATDVLRCLGRPGSLTTTDEELEIYLPLCAELGLRLQIPDQGRLSAVVGDVVRNCLVEEDRGAGNRR